MVNNIPCEELVGMQSALKAKAPHAALLCKQRQSHTLATKVKCRSLSNSYIKEVNLEPQLRSHQKIQETSGKDRRKLEAFMRSIKSGGTPTDIMKDCSTSQADTIQRS